MFHMQRIKKKNSITFGQAGKLVKRRLFRPSRVAMVVSIECCDHVLEVVMKRKYVPMTGYVGFGWTNFSNLSLLFAGMVSAEC